MILGLPFAHIVSGFAEDRRRGQNIDAIDLGQVRTAHAKQLSSDHDPLYRFYQWEANLRVLDVKEIKTVPYVPLSHPFVERLIGRFGESSWTKHCSGQQPT